MEPSNKKVLFVDDSTPRFYDVKKIYPNSTLVTTAQDAIDALSNNTYDLVFLDYNLKKHYTGEGDPGNGMDVVKWIVSSDKVPKSTEFIVHSLHYKKPIKMTKKLRKAGYNATRMMFGTWLMLQRVPKEN